MVALLGLATLASLAACTETPGYFPPCVDNAPCPSDDSGTDASPDADAGASSDAPAEAH
jgi:predicted small lipoprotein YifL